MNMNDYENTKPNNNDNNDDSFQNEKPLILLVDDIPQNVQILHEILNTGEYSFAIATSGEDALRLVDKKKPDLILLDIMLGDIDGFDVCKRLKERQSTFEIPIIFLTAKVGVEDKVKGFQLGAVDYITKPFENAEVLARVQTHIKLKLSMDLLTVYNRELNGTLVEMQLSSEELQKSQSQLIEREKEVVVKAVSVSASHEINQPVTVIQGYLDLLRESMDFSQLSPVQAKYFNRIENGLKKLVGTLEKFRKHSYLFLLDNEPSLRKKNQ